MHTGRHATGARGEGGKFGVQLLGILAVGVFIFGISWLTWMALKLGIEAYPEFVLMPDPDHVDELRNRSGEP